MAKMLDLILIVVAVAGFMALSLYKLVLMFRYRNDQDKLRALVSSGQVFPKRLHRFIYDEDDAKAGKASALSSRLK
jgi:L-asparagine transporter-like permease